LAKAVADTHLTLSSWPASQYPVCFQGRVFMIDAWMPGTTITG
jgi:hypothetical protein